MSVTLKDTHLICPIQMNFRMHLIWFGHSASKTFWPTRSHLQKCNLSLELNVLWIVFFLPFWQNSVSLSFSDGHKRFDVVMRISIRCDVRVLKMTCFTQCDDKTGWDSSTLPTEYIGCFLDKTKGFPPSSTPPRRYVMCSHQLELQSVWWFLDPDELCYKQASCSSIMDSHRKNICHPCSSGPPRPRTVM